MSPYWFEALTTAINLERGSLALGILFGTVVLLWIVPRFVANRLLGITKKTKSDIDDRLVALIRRPLAHFVLLGGVYLAVLALQPPPGLVVVVPDWIAEKGEEAIAAFELAYDGMGHSFSVLSNLIEAGFLLLIAFFMMRLIDMVALILEAKAAKTETKLDDQLVPLVRKTLKIFAVILLFIVFVQNLGYSVSGFLAGLGIGGLALALAAKDSIANLFGTIMIFTDQPFQIGDRVSSGGVVGTVEEVGFRSTKLRLSDNTLVSVPNSEIAMGTIQNQSRRKKRRLDISIGLSYETTPEKMEAFIAAVDGILKENESLDGEHRVHFTGFGTSTLDVVAVAYTRGTDFRVYLDVGQAINLRIMRVCKDVGVEMAFESRTLYVRGGDGGVVPTFKMA